LFTHKQEEGYIVYTRDSISGTVEEMSIAGRHVGA
jgi:hypothetical protein